MINPLPIINKRYLTLDLLGIEWVVPDPHNNNSIETTAEQKKSLN